MTDLEGTPFVETRRENIAFSAAALFHLMHNLSLYFPVGEIISGCIFWGCCVRHAVCCLTGIRILCARHVCVSASSSCNCLLLRSSSLAPFSPPLFSACNTCDYNSIFFLSVCLCGVELPRVSQVGDRNCLTIFGGCL